MRSGLIVSRPGGVSILAALLSESATMLLPGQDKLAPLGHVSSEFCVVVSYRVRLSLVGLPEIRKQ